MSNAGFGVANDIGGWAFKVDPSGSIKIGDTSDDTTEITGSVFVNGGAVFNEDAADADFRVESNTVENMLFVDASTNRIGIGRNDPKVTFDIQERDGIEACLRLMGTADVGIRLAADSDNAGEDDNPYIDFYQDGLNSDSRNWRAASIAMVGTAGTTFTDSIANAFYLDSFVPNSPNASRPLQIATDSTSNGHKARITIEGTNGHIGLHKNNPAHELDVAGTTKSTDYITDVGTRDLGNASTSTLSGYITAGVMILDADSITGAGDPAMHTLTLPDGSTNGEHLTLIVNTTFGPSDDVMISRS